MKQDILSMDLTQLTEAVTALGLPKFRAGQIYRWLHKAGVASFDEMTDLSLSLRQTLHDSFVIFSCGIEKKQVSAYDNTVKYLFSLHDGEWIESVAEQTGTRFLYSWETLAVQGKLPESAQNGDGLHLTGEAFTRVMQYIRTHAYK